MFKKNNNLNTTGTAVSRYFARIKYIMSLSRHWSWVSLDLTLKNKNEVYKKESSLSELLAILLLLLLLQLQTSITKP